MRCSRPASRVHILLPVGISFYTFTQIAFLVDAYRGKVARYALPHYALFVTYFPHLIAGPILHHKDMIPQFERAETKRPDPHLILCGLIIFAIGLFKKTCLADGIQPLVALAFGPSAPSFDQAWIGALAYTFQLYFDFSGYSDMAIGISLMFGIFLPLNFNSPYKATSIIDFWRRWHMTLSQFLRDYLYIPLGGNRRGRVLRYVNLMITMLLGGLWHGAAWTFVVWGALHGVYLCINHAWNNYGPAIAPRFAPLADIAALRSDVPRRRRRLGVLPRRQPGVGAVRAVEDGRSQPASPSATARWLYALFIAIYAAIAWFAPNTQEIMGYDHAQPDRRREARRMAAAAAVPLRDRGGAGVRDSRNPAAQRIHLFQVLMSAVAQKPAAVSRRERVSVIAGGGGAQFRRRSAAAVPAGAAVHRDVFARQPHAECRPDPQPGFDTVFMGTSLAIHFRQSDIDRSSASSLKLAMTGSNRTNRALCWPRRWRVIRSG